MVGSFVRHVQNDSENQVQQLRDGLTSARQPSEREGYLQVDTAVGALGVERAAGQ